MRSRSVLAIGLASTAVSSALALALTACGFDGAGSGPIDTAATGAAGDGGAFADGSLRSGDGAPSDLLDASSDAVDLPKPLVLTWAKPPAKVDLEAEGTLAWIHFGTETDEENSYNEKASAIGALPRFTVTGSTDIRTYEDNFTTFTWTNGAAMASQSGTRNGVYSKTGFPEFHLDRVVGSAPQRWVVYAGVYKCTALLTVTLGDGPTDPKATAVLDSTDHGYARYVIDHRAPKDGTPLKVTWKLTKAYDPNNANVTLAAQTLSALAP